MLGSKLLTGAAATLSLFSVAAAQVDPIVIKGSKFFYKTNGTQFFIRGVAYQQNLDRDDTTGEPATTSELNDPLADVNGCRRDLSYLQALRTNTVRVYTIDPEADHDECMDMFADAGIYVLADLSSPSTSINRIDPQWDDALYARYTSVIDTMSQYTNTLGFFAGNEVSNNLTNIDAIPFVKAAVRDTKAYIKRRNYRELGVGYAADDDQFVRAPLQNYINCGDPDESVDFFGYNIYSWCGDSTYQTSGYADHTEEFSNYTVPSFFAEYGCNKVEPRQFDETLALYGDNMTEVWSGGIVFEYFQAENNYGLVELDGSDVSPRDDYTALSRQIAKVSPTGVNSASYEPTNTRARDCPNTDTFPGWTASTELPPTPNEELCSCMVRNLTCVARDNVDSDAYDSLFMVACDPTNGEDICDGIQHNGTTGQYGAYSMCSAAQQLSWAFNALYQQQRRENSANTEACDFGGNATQQQASIPSGCRSLVDEAGEAGTGTVTSIPTGTGAGAAGQAGSSSDAAAILGIPSLDLRYLSVGVYVTVAALAGAGMILL